MKNIYKTSLFNEELENLSFENKKIFTFVKNDNFFGEGMFDVWLEEGQYKRLGLRPQIYSVAGTIGCMDSYSSSWSLKDGLKEMSTRIILF